MSVTVYRSSDASAPTLTGQAGSVTAILDACLVNGYGAKSAAGWAIEFTATNIRAYRSASGNRLRLRVDDTAAQEARITGYEVMTDVNTGTGQFPLPAQQSGGLYIRKSETSDTTVRSWMLVASEKFFHFLPYSNANDFAVANSSSYHSGYMMFGEFNSFKPGDAYNTLILASNATGNAQCQYGTNGRTSGFSLLFGHYVARNYLQFGISIPVAKLPLLDPTVTTTYFGVSTNYPPFPDGIVGGLNVSPIVVVESGHNSSALVRGIIPGIWAPLHNLALNHFDIISGSGDLTGKTLQSIFSANGGQPSRVLLEISNTW
jgi:hypothetical protein